MISLETCNMNKIIKLNNEYVHNPLNYDRPVKGEKSISIAIKNINCNQKH